MIHLIGKTKQFKLLGDGQIWDLKEISPVAAQDTFEDLFSGRALAGLAQKADQQLPKNKRTFSRFREKGKITGLSVTRALLGSEAKARQNAAVLIDKLAQNGAAGITALTGAGGSKDSWSAKEKAYWKDLDRVIIGAGVSEGLTGRILVRGIKKYLSRSSLSRIRIVQAKFPGKEAGFLGAVASILSLIFKEAAEKKAGLIAAVGIDLGREDIGVGLVTINPALDIAIVKRGKNYWLFKDSVKTASRRDLNIFLDARRDYTAKEKEKGRRIRASILNKMAALILKAQQKAKNLKFTTSRHIAVAVPGCPSAEGYILHSTDYLPFLRKDDAFNLARNLENLLTKKGLSGYHIHLINDGIAAGIANIYFNLSQAKNGEKIAFLGPGSGLGGCVGKVGAR